MKAKRGGNGVVTFAGDRARKTLLWIASKEKRQRFNGEIRVLRAIAAQHGLPNVVEILDFDTEAEPPWYEMRRYAGDSNDLLAYTRKRVPETARLFIPIVGTLKVLADSPTPIYHRDMKPENLLHSGKPELALADFGCAFLQTDEERFTPEFRAVGAMAYRAPEYQHGRVDQVNEKGDIFSLGKLLWYFFNGVEHEIFPYTLWYPESYNLVSKFPDTEGVTKLNLIIASAVHHDPAKRISYDELLAGLTDLTTSLTATGSEMERVEVMAYEQDVELTLERHRSITLNILGLFWDDLDYALSVLKQDLPDSGLVANLIDDFNTHSPKQQWNFTLEAVIGRESDSPVWNHKQPGFAVHAQVFPQKQWNTAFPHPDGQTAYPFVRVTIESTNRSKVTIKTILCWYYEDDKGPMQVAKLEKMAHQRGLLYSVLRGALKHLVS